MFPTQLLPESAPFSGAQRAWLNGFIAGILDGNAESNTATASAGSASTASPSATQTVQVAEVEEHFPWHDATLTLDDRMKLAEGASPERQLMAAMAQLDCGSCGYLCKTYAEAIATGADKDLNKCTPGGKATASKLKELIKLTINASGPVKSVAVPKPAAESAGQHSRSHPFPAPLICSRRLTSDSSEKDVRHVEIGLKGSGLTYKVGDALGVWPENDLDLVCGILDRLQTTGAEEAKSIDGNPTSLFDALRRERVITQPTEALIELLVDYCTDHQEGKRLQNMLTEQGGEPLEGLHVLDILKLVPSSYPPSRYFVDALGTIQPRLYSISSSPKAHVGQVHLTVGTVRYKNKLGRHVGGVASTYLAERLRPGEKLRVFVHESKHFGLPDDIHAPIIMIGPGTGIAPFRAFLHERRAVGSRGKSWLFFGDQRASSDFLYRDELDDLRRDGYLARMDTAFSRDQAEKVYVQHRMKQRGAELWKWLNEGAHLYVCGDAKRMASDVDKTLQEIVCQEGKLQPDSAKQFVKELSQNGRYQRDVY